MIVVLNLFTVEKLGYNLKKEERETENASLSPLSPFSRKLFYAHVFENGGHIFSELLGLHVCSIG